MVAAEVRTEMIGHCHVGMRFGHFHKRRVSRINGSDVQQFHVHHVVDDDTESPVSSVPRARTAYCLVESGCQRLGCPNNLFLVSFVVGQAIAVAETAIDLETYVMVFFVVNLSVQAFGHVFSCFAQFFIVRVFVKIP